VINDSILRELPELKVIGKYGVGLDMIDPQALARHGVRLGWTGGVNKRCVAELTLSFMLSLFHRVPAANFDVRQGVWKQLYGNQLTGKTIGIVGCGHIGKDLVGLLKPFQCRVLVNDILDFPDFYARNEEVHPVGLEELLRNSDLVTLHVPADESTRNIVSAERLSWMKPTAFLINAARGGLVDEVALKKMLIEGRLAGAAFDVFTIEPPQDHELLRLPNFFATPHIGGSAEEAVLAMGRAAIDGLEA
jgi:D-3-phosphoglycerate dehydrogenase